MVYVWLLIAVVVLILAASAAFDARYRHLHGRTPKIGRINKRGRRRADARLQRREGALGPRLGDGERRESVFADDCRQEAPPRPDRDESP